MKKIYILISIFIVLSFGLSAQDSIYLYKNNQVISKYATADIDSITFEHIVTVSKPVLNTFSFTKRSNSFLKEDFNCDISGLSVQSDIPLLSRTMVATFTTDPGNTVKVNGVEQVSGVTANDFTNPLVYTVTTSTNETVQYTVTINWITGLPEVIINTLNNEPIVSKDYYLRAYVQIDGKGFYPNFADSTRIRGRGNSTWGMPKKPYRLKLDNDGSPFGLAAEKDWVLLADYLDPTHLLNPVAFKIGQMLGLPFTNHGIPVSVTLNGHFLGVYTFTEQVERSKTRVNINKNSGVLLEMDQYFDELFKFRTSEYELPVMVKEPDLEEMSVADQKTKMDMIFSDFTALEEAMNDPNFPNNNYKDLIDIESVVKYLLTCDITNNMEINHPKSTYMHKDIGKKYFMGPIWDFDWAYGFEGTNRHFVDYQKPLLTAFTHNAKGTTFFKRFLEDPEVKALYKSTWEKFKANDLSNVIKYIEDHAENIYEYQLLERKIWSNGTSDYRRRIEEFKTWMKNRADFITTSVNNM